MLVGLVLVGLVLVGALLGDLSYKKDIKPIFQKHCAQCHNANWPDKNWMDYQIALKNKDKIKLRVGNRSMPVGASMPEEDRKKIIDWVNQGAKE